MMTSLLLLLHIVSDCRIKQRELVQEPNSSLNENENAEALEAGSNEVDGEQSMVQCQSVMAELELEMRRLKQQCCNEFTTKCYQLKIHRSKDNDVERIVRNVHETRTNSVLDRVKSIENRWRKLDFWKILQSVNPIAIMKFDLQLDETLSKNTSDDLTFRKVSAFCCIFEDLMKSFGWKVGDTLDIEADICNIVGQLMMNVEAHHMSTLLNCFLEAIVNIQAHGSNRDDDKLRTLLIEQKKYNGLNLACILLEQMILDNKDGNVICMRAVCAQFIDLVVQLLIEPDYRGDIPWTLKYLMSIESLWSVADVYNLMKNGILMFQTHQVIFHRYLIRIRNFALHPSLSIQLSSDETVCLRNIIYCRDENKWKCLNDEPQEEKEKSLHQILSELIYDQTGQKNQIEKHIELKWIERICEESIQKRERYKDKYEQGIKIEIIEIEKYGVDAISSCLAVTSMATYTFKKSWPYITQLVSYCLLVARKEKNRGLLLEILTGEGKSCVIAMVAATYALLGRTVDIVTSSPVLSQRDAEEWREFYSLMKLEVGCNVEDNTKEDTTCYECPIVYGTVETFARDILKTEFLMQDVRKGRTCDIVIVDEVDSMLIDQGVQCTYLNQDVASNGMRHFEPILSLIWMHASKFVEFHDNGDMIWYRTEQELFFFTLSRISSDPLHILRTVEKKHGFRLGFTDDYLKRNIEDQIKLLRSLRDSEVKRFFSYAREYLNADINIYAARDFREGRVITGISILVYKNGLSSIVLPENMVKNRLTQMITNVLSDRTETGINMPIPIHLREHCGSRLQYWIDNAFVAQGMRHDREYIVKDNVVYPVDFKSTGVIETNKKWVDGLQQFLEMKHGLPISPLSLITNFLSNVDFFCQYSNKNNYAYDIILGVSGTLGGDAEKTFMRETFSVDFATIPTFKRRKLFELDGLIFEDELKWLGAMTKTIKSVVAEQRAVLVICEDIATANKIFKKLSNEVSEAKFYLDQRGDGYDERIQYKPMKPKDVVVTTNLGARGTHLVTNSIINKNGGLFVLVTFIPSNDRVEKQAFGRSGRRGETGSCQIMVYREEMPKWLRLCETVNEAKLLRNAVDKERLNIETEVNMMREKQELFRKYCDFKRSFGHSNKDLDSNDVKIQVEILDEAWVKWIQEWETNDRHPTKEELGQHLENCSIHAKGLESDNIYHLLNFGAIRLMKGEFEKAIEFYDRVIQKDPDWSAFACYNKAYCWLQMMGEGYIRRAIDDLKDARCKFKIYEWTSLFSEIHGYSCDIQKRLLGSEFNQTEETKSILTQYHIMMEYQLLQHVNTQITETIEKLEAIDSIGGAVKTMKRSVLDSMQGVDYRTEAMLHRYSQMGLLFTFNIDENPKFCYSSQIVSSSVVLGSLAVTILMALSSGIFLKCHSPELINAIDNLCNIGTNKHDALLWMSRCVSSAIVTGFNSTHFIRDVASLLPIKQTDLKASSKIDTKTEDFTKFENSNATSMLTSLAIMTRDINKLASSKEEEISLHTNSVVMTILRKKIDQIIQETFARGQNLHGTFNCFIRSMRSQSRSDLQQLVYFILYQISDAIIQTNEFQNTIIDLRSRYQNIGFSSTTLKSVTSEITAIAAVNDNDIALIISKFLELFLAKIEKLIDRKNELGSYCVDEDKLEATNKIIKSLLGDIIEATVESSIVSAIMFDLQEKIKHVFSSFHSTLSSCSSSLADRFRRSKPKSMEGLLRRLKEFHRDPNKSLIMRLMAEVKVVSEYCECNIVISDSDKHIILRMSSSEYRKPRELVYSPPSPAYPAGQFQSCVDGRVVRFKRQKKKRSPMMLMLIIICFTQLRFYIITPSATLFIILMNIPIVMESCSPVSIVHVN